MEAVVLLISTTSGSRSMTLVRIATRHAVSAMNTFAIAVSALCSPFAQQKLKVARELKISCILACFPGYGLTYSNFTYERHETTPAVLTVFRGNLTSSTNSVPLSFACVVTNVGLAEADAVVLAFVRPPSAMQQPKKRLIGFERVALRSQESTVVAFGLGTDALSSVDEYGRVVPAGVGERWWVEVGDVVRPASAEVSVTA